MSKIPTEQKFLPPEASESLPTFRQIGNYFNSISSASTIFFERDNTHTRLESDLKINSNKPSVDLQVPSNLPAKGQSDILSYSQTSSIMHFEDSLMHLKKMLCLLSSKENMNNHIRQSLVLSGLGSEASKNIAKIVTESFSQYINMASKIQSKIIKEEITGSSSKINDLNKQIISLKQQNLKLFEKVIKLESDNSKYRKKIVSLKERIKNPPTNFMIISHFKEQFNKVLNKMVHFEAKIFDKFINFQDSLIAVTQLRNRLIKTRQFNLDKIQKGRMYEKQNQMLQLSLELKSGYERQAMKELSQNTEANKSQIQVSKRTIKQKNDEIAKLNSFIRNISEQLNEQKNLYEQMLDKNIELEKQIYIISSKQKESSQSFCIVQKDQEMNYINEEAHNLEGIDFIQIDQ